MPLPPRISSRFPFSASISSLLRAGSHRSGECIHVFRVLLLQLVLGDGHALPVVAHEGTGLRVGPGAGHLGIQRVAHHVHHHPAVHQEAEMLHVPHVVVQALLPGPDPVGHLPGRALQAGPHAESAPVQGVEARQVLGQQGPGADQAHVALEHAPEVQQLVQGGLAHQLAEFGHPVGGLKQITPVDEEGHKIIDFSLYDARRAGFTKIVFVIKHQIEEDFKNGVGRNAEKYFDVKYVFQELDRLPEGFSVPEGRTKPWGTAHAIACAAEAIDGPFAVINADDFYGSSSFKKIYDFLKEERGESEHAMVGYRIANTVTDNGSVSRGICTAEDGYLSHIVERTKIFRKGGDAEYTEDNGKTFHFLPGQTLVSMNLWGFQHGILESFQNDFASFLRENLDKNPLKCEYVLPAIPDRLIREKKATVRVIPTEEKWFGVTYAADLDSVKQAVVQKKQAGIYPEHLWMKPAAAYHFPLDGAPASICLYGKGHINTTYLVTTTSGKRYILQKIKDTVFDVPPLMENIERVIRVAQENEKKQTDETGEMQIGSLNLIDDLDGHSYYRDETGYYRVYDYVEGTICLQAPESNDDFYQSAAAFGAFQKLMQDFPAEELHETIPDFHNTVNRYRIFHETVSQDPLGRAAGVSDEIRFALDREEAAGALCRLRESGALPLRVTHNDTKLNNVLLDEKTRKARCVIDLDTVMPGLAAYDFGDAIRFGAATAAEDERDLSRMTLDLERFRIFTRGYLEYGPDFSEKEIETFPLGAIIMTLECGVRFLTDYLEGDRYFAIHRDGQNLDRARTQFRLVSEMEKHLDEMKQIVREEEDRRNSQQR